MALYLVKKSDVKVGGKLIAEGSKVELKDHQVKGLEDCLEKISSGAAEKPKVKKESKQTAQPPKQKRAKKSKKNIKK